MVGLFAGDCVSVAVAGGGHGVDCVDGASGGSEAGDEQATGGLDRDRDRGVGRVDWVGHVEADPIRALEAFALGWFPAEEA